MRLPSFAPGDDPGPSFSDLIRHLGSSPARRERTGSKMVGDGNGFADFARSVDARYLEGARGPLAITHGTTIVALRYSAGVVMAGDRRATEGHTIAHRVMDKVMAADRYSGVAIAGAAGPAMEMVKLFQTELEHYEKVEGSALSLEGKANKLGQMVRANLPMAMEGLVVVPIFAGYDLRRATGRIFSYDVTGGRYEEADFKATGSGGRDARTTVKLGWRPGLDRSEAFELAVSGLFEAADEDSATGGPDVVRGIYPTVATITAAGFERVNDAEVAERFAALLAGRPTALPAAAAAVGEAVGDGTGEQDRP
ncbi:MAG: proteasome subunit beta [Acidimicrobiales bacterium]